MTTSVDDAITWLISNGVDLVALKAALGLPRWADYTSGPIVGRQWIKAPAVTPPAFLERWYYMVSTNLQRLLELHIYSATEATAHVYRPQGTLPPTPAYPLDGYQLGNTVQRNDLAAATDTQIWAAATTNLGG